MAQKTYHIAFDATKNGCLDVEASSEAEALEKAQEIISKNDYDIEGVRTEYFDEVMAHTAEE